MILDKLLEIPDFGNVIPTDNPELIFCFLHEAILDSHLYLSKAIGFRISVPDTRAKSSTFIARHSEIADSYTEMMSHIQDKIFLTMEQRVAVALVPGVNTLENSFFKKSRKHIECRYVDSYICRVLRKECTLKLVLALNNGYMDMKQCSAEVGVKYFPLYTYFNLGDFVRVLPPEPGEKAVRVRYYNGFTGEDFRKILQLNQDLYRTRNMKEDTRRWMSSFGQ